MVQDCLQHHWEMSCPGERGETGRGRVDARRNGEEFEERDKQSRLRRLCSHLHDTSPLDLDGLTKGADDRPDAARSSQRGGDQHPISV